MSIPKKVVELELKKTELSLICQLEECQKFNYGTLREVELQQAIDIIKTLQDINRFYNIIDKTDHKCLRINQFCFIKKKKKPIC